MNMPSPSASGGYQQLRLVQLVNVDSYRFEDPLEGWSLTDVRAMAIDPDIANRRLAALSNWNWDIQLQRVLATDPDETVLMHLLFRVDPAREVCRLIFAGPHTDARRVLARRNLSTETLLELIDDADDEVRGAARATLYLRGVLMPEPNEPATR